jgi:DTW domain-containing protein YfiP
MATLRDDEHLLEPQPAARSRGLLRCSACWLPPAVCVCDELPRLRVRTRLVVVMHRHEAITSTNTGRLAVQMLEGAELTVRGRRDAVEGARWGDGARFVLFPAPGARMLRREDASAAPITLFVPDGTWTQARNLLRRDDALRSAEPVTLPPSGPSRYGLRRNEREHGQGTLEAIAHALGILEGPEVEASLLRALDLFVERARRVRTEGTSFARASDPSDGVA